MTYQIKCNGRQLCYGLTRRQAVNAIKGLRERALIAGKYEDFKPVIKEKIEYILKTTDGLTYEMKAA